MKITLNGNTHIIEERASIAELIAYFRLDARKVAIEHNLCIIPANEYAGTYVADGDVVEVVQFIGGG
jgi:hypothetical protein